MTKVGQILVTCVFTILFTGASYGATFVVNTTSDTVDATPGDATCADAGGMCSLRAAISEANALAGSDIITLPAGTYTQSLVAANEDLNAGGDWDVTSVLTINGATTDTTILQANATIGAATERVINVRAGGNLTLNNLTVRHGRFNGTMTASTRGAGIENNAILTLTNVTVRDNVVNSTSGNSIGGGIHNAGTALTLINSTVTANVNTRVSGGSAFGGGVSSITPTTITITDSSISGNTAQSIAGGFGFGAGLYLESVFNLTATGSRFDMNTANGTSGSNGVGVRALSNAGAAVFNATNCTFNGNTGTAGTSTQGTGLQFFTTTTAAATNTVTLDRVTVNGNVGNNTGPGAGVNGTATGGSLTINIFNSTVSNNSAALNGAGVSMSNTGATVAGGTHVLNMRNTTVSGNTAVNNGGGVFVEGPVATSTVTANLNFVTVANNRANNDNTGAEGGGGIAKAITGVFNLKNSVVADNTVGTGGTGPDALGSITSQDYNHIEDPTGATIGGTTTNNTTGDPQLGPLAPNGGPTNTHLPGAASPVLNTIPNGTNDCGNVVMSDQRGQSRPSGTGCEKGSVEVAAVTGPFDISGRVLTSDGRGIRNVIVVISGGSLPAPLRVQTGSFGTYAFNDLAPGSYTITVFSKRFTFAMPSRMVNLTSDITNENFVAEPGFGMRPGEEPDQR